ncbi:MAG: hypothetical protein VKL39_16510 [Leptolyngbyaceae bacterium]|nr:hypothetical protein [Leptolyngbyaceae bacterium]
MLQRNQGKLNQVLIMGAIALAGILMSSCSGLSSGENSLLSSIGRPSESENELTDQPVFDPFYDAVTTATLAAEQTQVAQTPDEWRAIAEQWQSAIEMMKAVPVDHPKYDIAQQRALETYPTNFEYAQSQAGDQELSDLSAADNKLTEVDFGEGWPFLVDGEILCEFEEAGDYTVRLVTFHSIGEVFAVNSPAQARANERGWLDVRHVWRDSPLGDGKAPMTWVVMRGEALCQ